MFAAISYHLQSKSTTSDMQLSFCYEFHLILYLDLPIELSHDMFHRASPFLLLILVQLDSSSTISNFVPLYQLYHITCLRVLQSISQYGYPNNWAFDWETSYPILGSAYLFTSSFKLEGVPLHPQAHPPVFYP